jgi:lysine 2,3-aminomutase
VLARNWLEELLTRLRAIPHIEIVRIGSRVPVFMPMRITEENYARCWRNFHPLWLNIHVKPSQRGSRPSWRKPATGCCAPASPLGNQSVLWRASTTVSTSSSKLVAGSGAHPRAPYYLYICDLVEGVGHFRTPVSKGIEIIEGLRGHTSGFAVPTFVVDAPGGGRQDSGLCPITILAVPDHKVGCAIRRFHQHLRRTAGFINSHDPSTCAYCSHPALEGRVRSAACWACWKANRCPSNRRVSTIAHARRRGASLASWMIKNGNRWASAAVEEEKKE